MTGLLETYGQGGIADAPHQEAYDSSFLIADPAEAFVLETAGADYAVAPFPGGVAISNRIAFAPSGHGPPPASLPARTSTASATTTRTPPSPMSAWRPAAASSTAAVPAASPRPPRPPTCATTARARGARPGPTDRSMSRRAGWGGLQRGHRLHARARAECHRRVHDRGAARRAGRRARRCRVFVAPGSPCASIYVPAFPRTAAGPPPFVPVELSGEDLWQAADALRRRVEDDPDALRGGPRVARRPWRTSCGPRPTTCSSSPPAGLRSARRGAPRTLEALRSCIPSSG